MKSMLTAARQPENFSVKTFYERPSWSNGLHIVCGSFSGIANREVSVSSPPKNVWTPDSRLLAIKSVSLFLKLPNKLALER